LHAFFTATSIMDSSPAAGIVVRNSIILVDFIELRPARGYALDRPWSTRAPFDSAHDAHRAASSWAAS